MQVLARTFEDMTAGLRSLDRLRRRTEERLAKRLRELTVLHAVAHAAVRSESSDELIEHVTEIVGNSFYTHNFGFLMVNKERGVLEVHPSYHLRPEAPRHHVALPLEGPGVTVFTARTGVPMNVPVVEKEPRYVAGDPDTRSELCVPVQVAGEVIGVINAESPEPHAFSVDDEHLLMTVAHQVGLALERLWAEEDRARRTRQLEAIVGLTHELRKADSASEIPAIVLRFICDMFDPAAAAICLREQKDESFTIEEASGIWQSQRGQKLTVEDDLFWHLAEARSEPVITLGTSTLRRNGLVKCLAVPMADQHGVLGGLVLGFEGDLPEDAPTIVRAMADVAVSSLTRARYHDRIHRQLRERERLREFGLRLSEASDLHQIYRQTVAIVHELIPSASTVVLSRYDEETQQFHALYGMHDGEEIDIAALPPMPLEPPGSGVQSEAVHAGEPVRIADLQARLQRVSRRVDLGREDGRVTRSALAAPVVSRGKVIGVLQVQSYDLAAFTEEDASLLGLIANAVGVVMENTRLFEETRQRMEQLRSLRAIDQAIRASFDLELILTIALREVTHHLGVDVAAVLLLDDAGTLRPVAGQGFRGDAYARTSLRLGEGYAGKVALEKQPIYLPDLSQQPDFVRKSILQEEEFKVYAAVPMVAKGMVKGVLEVYHRAHLPEEEEWFTFLESVAGQLAIAVESVELFEGLQRAHMELLQAYDATLEGWVRVLDLRDQETEGHSLRVAEMTVRLARLLGVSEDELVHIRRGALLHHIGKMAIPDAILRKPGPLTEEEWAVMRQHPVVAYNLLAPIPYLRPALDIPYCHHEKWDGSGYPRGLKGETIPLPARIFAVIDVWDALTCDRPYRKAWPEAEALAYLQDQAGKHFDPDIVPVFLEHLSDLRRGL